MDIICIGVYRGDGDCLDIAWMNGEPTLKTLVQIVDKPLRGVDKLKWLYDMGRTWRAVSDAFCGEIPPATLHAYAHGRPVVNPDHRFLLDLPPLVKVEACPACGVVHTRKTCPRRNGRPKPPPRIAIRKDDHRSAAQSIRNNCSPEFVRALLEELRDGGR